MRKTSFHVVTTDGRDKGKRFLLTEMPALTIEKWAMRAILALSKAGAEIPEGAVGIAAIAEAGMRALAKLDFADAAPLLDEMMTCVQIVPDPKHPEITRPLVMNEMEGDDVEELSTLWELREAVFKLHTEFFFPAKR